VLNLLCRLDVAHSVITHGCDAHSNVCCELCERDFVLRDFTAEVRGLHMNKEIHRWMDGWVS